MFSKLLDNPDLPLKEQKEVLKSVLSNNLKQNFHEVKLQFNHNYEKLKPILLQHWKYAMRLALALHTWQVAAELLEGKRQTSAIDLLYAVASEDHNTRAQYLLVDLAKSYQDNWRALVVLAVVSEVMVEHLTPQNYNWLLAVFVKISATAIQGYLTVKNEPAQSSNDRIESDQALINSCEQWVTRAYVGLISSLKNPSSEEQKHVVLAAFSQICGALLENERGAQLAVQRLKEIERAAGDYLLRALSLKWVGQEYLRQLKASNYSVRLKKIEIPNEYNGESQFAKEGICWLLLLYLNRGEGVYSDQFRLRWLLLAFSQSLQSPLHLKDEALSTIKNIWKQNICYGAFELGYPVGLLLFNVHSSSKQEFQYFKERLGLGADHGNDLRRWRRLLNIDLGLLNVEKWGLVVSQLSQVLVKQKQVLLLIKAIKFDFTSEQLNKSVSALLRSVVQTHSEGKKIVSWLVEHEKSNNRNVLLCDELTKNLSL